MTASRTRRGTTAPRSSNSANVDQVPEGVKPELGALRIVMDRLVAVPDEASGDQLKLSVENLTRLITVSLKAIELAWSQHEANSPDLDRLLDGILEVHARANPDLLPAAPAIPERMSPC